MKDAPPTAIAELQGRPQWVLWRTIERDGKPTKIPFQPNGQIASSTDPETWSTYAECAAAVKHSDGLGYVFSPDDEFAGIDLDHCVDDAGVVHPGAQKIVERLESYTEFSPTGTGLHVLVRAHVNGKRNRTKNTPWEADFEVYDHARFFTVTARQLFGTPATIEARQAELDVVYAELFPPSDAKPNGAGVRRDAASAKDAGSTLDDVELEEKIRASKQGSKFTELFDRGAPEGKESEADLGLCNILAFWLGPDESRIDAWFRRSALMRDKWDDKRGATTYGGYTIDRALEGKTEFYGQKTPRPRLRHDDPELSYADEITGLFGLIDDPIVHGRRYGKKATAHVVFTTRSGAVLDLDSWKAATSSPATLAQEIGVQLGVEVTLKKEDIKRLNVLVGKYCELRAAITIEDRARELGAKLLQAAEKVPVDMKDTAQRWAIAQRIRETDPVTDARASQKSIAASCFVLVGKDGRRYVKVQWFIDFVKAAAVGSTGTAIIDRIESVGWTRPNTQGKVKFTNPTPGAEPAYLYEVFYEVPEDWETEGPEVT